MLEHAAASGVSRIVLPAYDPTSRAQVQDLAYRYSGRVHAALRLHPRAAAEPRHVRDVAAAIAGLRGIDIQTVAEVTARNAADLFGLPARL